MLLMIKECHETVSSLGTGSEQVVAETSDLSSGSLQCLFYIAFFQCWWLYSLFTQSVWAAGWVVVKGVVWHVAAMLMKMKSFCVCLCVCVTNVPSIHTWFSLLYSVLLESWQWDWAVCMEVTVKAIFPGWLLPIWQVTSSVSIRPIMICSLHLQSKVLFPWLLSELSVPASIQPKHDPEDFLPIYLPPTNEDVY